MLRSTGGIGLDALRWRTAVNRVGTKNDAITEKLNPMINWNHFTSLTEILERLEEVNALAERYKEVVGADVDRLRELEERLRRGDGEMAAHMFMAV